MVQKDLKLNIDDILAAGVNLGHRISRLHPKMKQYVSGVKNGVHTIDSVATIKELEKVLQYISKIISEGKVLLFVGTKPQLKNITKKAAEECNMPYVTERWLGGTFTNFETIKKRVEYFKNLELQKASGGLDKYTKKERLDFNKEIASLETKFNGIKNMQKLPEAVFIAGIDRDETCAREAKKKGIKIIALCDTNINPDIADYPIPANDDAISAVQYVLEKIKSGIINAKQEK